jgi:hypothetical protein
MATARDQHGPAVAGKLDPDHRASGALQRPGSQRSQRMSTDRDYGGCAEHRIDRREGEQGCGRNVAYEHECGSEPRASKLDLQRAGVLHIGD